MRRLGLLLSLVLVVAACSGDDGEAGSTTTGPAATSTTAVVSTPTTVPPSTTTTEPPTLLEPPVFDRWTTILASLPIDEASEEEALERARKRIDFGTGVLVSADYPSLNPGYWVVFSGDFATRDEAIGHCVALQEQGVDCYHRYLGDAPTVVVGRAEGTAVAWVDQVLSIVDLEVGVVADSITDFYAGGGTFPGRIELSPDGTQAYFSLGFEDYWYACDTSAGQIDRVDLTTGEQFNVAEGFGPRISPDGTTLAYVASAHCIPNPDAELEVISFADTVVVRDLITGAERSWGPSPGLAETPDSLVASVAWDGAGDDLFVAMEDGSLRLVDTDVGGPLDTFPTVGSGREAGLFGTWVLVGVDRSTSNLLAVEFDFETATSRIIEISTSTGIVVSASSPWEGFVDVGLDALRTERIVSGSGFLWGSEAGELGLGPDPYFEGADF